MKKILLVVVFLLFFIKSFSQIIEKDYYNYSKNKIINKTYYLKDKNIGATQRLVFLGEVTDNKLNTYKVLASYIKISERGINDLIFISKNGKVNKYRFNEPGEMPTHISFNKLFFWDYENKKSDFIVIDELKSLLCVPFYGCFERG